MKKVRLLISIAFSLIMFLNVTFPSMATELGSSRVRLVIESYEVDNGFVSSGNETEIKLVIRNTNKMFSAKNVVVSVMNSQGIVFPIEGYSNQIHVGDISAGASCEVVMPMRIAESDNISDNIHDVSLQFNFSFADGNSSDRTEQAYVSIPLRQECSPKIIGIKLADKSCAKDNSIISTEIENSGSVVAEEINLHIILQDGQEFAYSIGDIDGGLTKYFDHTICIPQAGIQNVTAYLSYKDERDNAFTTETVDYEVRVLEESSDKLNLQNDNINTNYKQILIINAILVLIAISIIFIFHKRDTRRINSGKEVGYGKRS